MSTNDTTFSWHIGSDDEGVPMPDKRWKAYFYWKKDGAIIESKALHKDELRAEIERLKRLGEDVSEYEKAYSKL